jgi:hypothetical protein
MWEHHMRLLAGRWVSLSAQKSARLVAFVALFASCCALIPARAQTTPSGKPAVISGYIIETYDRLPPDGAEGIEKRHSFRITLSGKNHVDETWTSRGAFVGRYGHAHNRITQEDENSATIGDNSARAVWHVLGPNKLQRLFAGQHFLLILNIELGSNNACHLEAKYLQQAGFTFIVAQRSDNLEMANFSLPRVSGASCTVQ